MNKFKDLILKSFYIQLALLTVVAFVYLFVCSWECFLSSIYGSLVSIVPSFFFALLFFKKERMPAKKVIKSFYLAEAIKFITTIILFVLFLIYVELKPLAFFISFIVLQMTSWFLGLFNFRKIIIFNNDSEDINQNTKN